MKKYKEEFSHELIMSVEYAHGGATAKAKILFVKAPCNAQLESLAELEQANNEALINVSVKLRDVIKGHEAQESKSDKITDGDAEQHIFLLSGNGFKIKDGLANLKAILAHQHNPALMDGKEPMTELLFEQLSPVDTRILLGKYLLNFLNFSQPA